jgi:phospholipid/cholesterol/gamma-HCH transport system substrate-binding protein
LFCFNERNIKIIIIVVLAILLTNVVIYKLTHRADMKFIVQYDFVPAINKNVHLFRIDVHYRGYDVGDVTDVKLSKSQKHINFYVTINYKGLKLPTNSEIRFKTENIYGTRYLDVKYPEKPSGEFIKDGDKVDGKEAYERIDEYLIESISSAESKKIFQNLSDITDILNTSLKNKDNNKLLNQSAGDLAIILENLKSITQDPNFKKDIKSTIKYSSSSMKNVDEILNNKEIKETIIQSPASVNKTMKDIGQMTESMSKVSGILPDVNKNLDNVNNLLTDSNANLCTINTKVPTIPQSLVENAETLVVKTNCLECELSKILSKRFLIPRLIFGNPGKSFRTCAKCKRKAKRKLQSANCKE